MNGEEWFNKFIDYQYVWQKMLNECWLGLRDPILTLVFSDKIKQTKLIDKICDSFSRKEFQAILNQESTLAKKSWRSNYFFAKLVISCGGNIEFQDPDKFYRTPLFEASEKNKLEIISLLINNKANVNIRDELGVTPLHVACEAGSLESVKVLVQNHADLNAISILSETPLDKAIDKSLFI